MKRPRAEIIGAAGVLSVLAGLFMLAGLLPAAARHDPSAPLFGRDADGTLLTGGIDRTIRDWPAAGGAGTVLLAGAPE